MLERCLAGNGVVHYRSALLAGCGVPHGFSTRVGGVSAPPFDSLNLGRTAAGSGEPRDELARVHQNLSLLQEAIGCASHRRAWAQQVHGAGVHVVDGVGPVAPGPGDDVPDADALVTDQPGVLLTIRVADCVPILLADAKGSVVAAIHAGWRGLVAGVIARSIETMQDRFAVKAEALIAAVGPCISAAHYQVGPEVVEQCERRVGRDAVIINRSATGQAQLDLPATAAKLLTRAGLRREAIDRTDRCTFEHREEFFSHRRNAGRTGRMAAVIARGSWEVKSEK